MESICEFTALIQFIGAFNFAYILGDFDKVLKEHFFKANEYFISRFNEIKDLVETDEVSIETMKPLKLVDGNSNEASLDKLRKDYHQLSNDKIEIEKKIAESEKFRQNRFITSLFLMIGLYTISDLFFIGLIEHCSKSEYIQLSFIAYNIMNLIYVLYFCISESLYLKIGPNVCFILKPTKLWTSIISFIVFVLSFICPLINNYIINSFSIQIFQLSFIYNISKYLGIIIPLSSFVICIFFVLFKELRMRIDVDKKANLLIDRYNNLHKEKEIMDKNYKSFYSGITTQKV